MTDLEPADRFLLAAFKLSDGQKATVAQALEDAQNGALVVARECRDYGRARGNTGAGLLMHRLARGDHFDCELALERGDDDAPDLTGWKFVRGSHGSTYVRDPYGTDAPPKGFQLH